MILVPDWTNALRGRPAVRAFLDGDDAPLLVDRVDVDSASSCLRFARRLNQSLEARQVSLVDEHLIVADLQAIEKPKTVANGQPATPALLREQERLRLIESTDPDIVADAQAMLCNPCLVQVILDDLKAIGLVGEQETGLTIYLAGTSRLLAKPVSVIVVGTSSAGKSFILDTGTSLFPPEAVLRATDFTANALYYLPLGALEHRFVVAGERSRKEDDDRAEATRALREMLSSGVLRKAIPEKDGDGHFTTRVIENRGPIAFVETTTLSTIFNEDANRSLIVGVDESAEQTHRIIENAGSAAATSRRSDNAAVIDRHHGAQRLLERLPVVIPFAPKIVAAVPADRIEARRAVGHVLHLVQAVALLHQHQRRRQDGAVIAEFADYAIARRLLRGPLARAVKDDVAEHVRAFGLWLAGVVKGKDPFVVADLRKAKGCTWKKSSVYAHLRALEDAGLVGRTEQKKGAPYTLVRAPGKAAEDLLPTLAEVGAPAQPLECCTTSAFLCDCWGYVSSGALDTVGMAGNDDPFSSESNGFQPAAGHPNDCDTDGYGDSPVVQRGGGGVLSDLAAEELGRRATFGGLPR